MSRLITGVLALCIAGIALPQENRIDAIRHDAPELAAFGDYDIGVRTLEFIDSGRPDVLNSIGKSATEYYDRNLVVEIWYPAELAAGQERRGRYSTTTRNLEITATLSGKGVRDAPALTGAGPFPLVIVSHGYPGNRYLLSHLGENLASKGYVVASIDHRDSTYRDQQAFASTLYNRPLDQVFVIDRMAALSADPQSFLAGLVDADNTGIVGYSMGGYGLVINLGGGYSEALLAHAAAPPNELALRHAAANPEFGAGLDARIRAGFAVAPWGMAAGVWEPDDLARISVPTFFVAGSQDETAGYENGIRAIYEHALQSDRYLLTYVNAGHNAGAPIPLPVEIQRTADQAGAWHYTDPVWDTVRMNNIMDHFATAFFGVYLKGDEAKRAYLDLVPDSQDGVYAIEDGRPTGAHSYWKGFGEGSARGLRLEHLGSAE